MIDDGIEQIWLYGDYVSKKVFNSDKRNDSGQRIAFCLEGFLWHLLNKRPIYLNLGFFI